MRLGSDTNYASLVVLKSNLMCSHNGVPGQTTNQSLRHNVYLVYAADDHLALAIYREGPNGSAVPICTDPRREGAANLWSLECEYEAAVNEVPVFFAAVSYVGDVDGIRVDTTLPADRVYCSSGDQRVKVYSNAETDLGTNFLTELTQLTLY